MDILKWLMEASLPYDFLATFPSSIEHAKSRPGSLLAGQLFCKNTIWRDGDKQLCVTTSRSITTDEATNIYFHLIIDLPIRLKENSQQNVSIYVQGHQINSKLIFEVLRIQCELSKNLNTELMSVLKVQLISFENKEEMFFFFI